MERRRQTSQLGSSEAEKQHDNEFPRFSFHLIHPKLELRKAAIQKCQQTQGEKKKKKHL